MGRKKATIPSKELVKQLRPATTPEARENRLVSLAFDAAEQQLLDGTASSQVITQVLKLGSSTERLNRQILELKKELIEEQTKSLRSQQRTEELFEKAMQAFARYSGKDNEEYDEDYE